MIEEVDVTRSDGQSPVEVELAVTCGIKNGDVDSKMKRKTKFRDSTAIYAVTSSMDFIDFRRIGCAIFLPVVWNYLSRSVFSTKQLSPEKTFIITAQLTKPSQTVVVHISSVRDAELRYCLMLIFTKEFTAGIAVSQVYKPSLDHTSYPTMVTRPQTSMVRVHNNND